MVAAYVKINRFLLKSNCYTIKPTVVGSVLLEYLLMNRAMFFKIEEIEGSDTSLLLK